MAIKIARTIKQGILPSSRRPGLADPEGFTPGADRFGGGYLLVVNGSQIQSFISDHITSVEYADNEEIMDKLTIQLGGFIDDPETGRTLPIPEWVQSSKRVKKVGSNRCGSISGN